MPPTSRAARRSSAESAAVAQLPFADLEIGGILVAAIDEVVRDAARGEACAQAAMQERLSLVRDEVSPPVSRLTQSLAVKLAVQVQRLWPEENKRGLDTSDLLRVGTRRNRIDMTATSSLGFRAWSKAPMAGALRASVAPEPRRTIKPIRCLPSPIVTLSDGRQPFLYRHLKGGADRVRPRHKRTTKHTALWISHDARERSL